MNREEDSRQSLFTRRGFVLGAVQGALLTALVGRMYFLQISENRKYKLLARDNIINKSFQAPVRGLIYDRFGEPLAINQRSYSLVVSVRRTKDLDPTFANLKLLIGLTDEEIEEARNRVRVRAAFTRVTVRDNLDWSDVTKIEANTPDLPGVKIDTGFMRVYPKGETLAHVVGYVGRAFPEDVAQQRDPILLTPGFRIGRSGVEKSVESALRGSAGFREVEVNAIGKELRVSDSQPSENGLQIDLTIDATLQSRVHQRLLEERSAAAIVMDAHSGALRAVVSTPAFDPNDFITGFSQEKWQTLSADDRAPFRNKALAGQYAPGSTFKMLVALAALREGLDPTERINCEGKIEFGNQLFHCWNKWGHSGTNLKKSIRESCDVYYYELAQRIGIDKISQMAREFGLGQRLTFDMVGERSGNVPTREWKLEKRGEAWRDGDTLQASIGQGFVLATPIQLAVMTAALINGGFRVTPHFVEQGVLLERKPIDVPEGHFRLVKKAMDAVVNEERGTAFKARMEDEIFQMGGKTGTTQIRSISAAEREKGIVDQEDLPWRFRDHALYVGYAPVGAPNLVCAVIVEHGGSGGRTAAPIARDVLIAAQQRELDTLAGPTTAGLTDG